MHALLYYCCHMVFETVVVVITAMHSVLDIAALESELNACNFVH